MTSSIVSHVSHVNFLCRSVFLELCRIGHLRCHLTVDATKKLVSSFVLSRLDYCNSLLAGLPENKLDRLQRVKNNAARLVLGRWGRDHAKPLLRSLHWLPVRAWIEYKISTLCYRSRDSSAPAYFSDLLSVYQPSRSLRSAEAGPMTVPCIKLSKYRKHAFSYIGPVTWNSLPKPPSNPIWKCFSSKSICTDDFHKGVEQSWVSCISVYPVQYVCTNDCLNLLFYFYCLT